MNIIKSEKKKLRSPAEQRRAKGIALFQKGYAVCLDAQQGANMYKVWSETEPVDAKGRHAAYAVYLDIKEEDNNSCSCPDFQYNTIECKHIIAAKYARHEVGYPLH